MQFYYLSPCARTSAYWLTDKHIEDSVVEVPRLLCTAAQLVAAQTSKFLLNPSNANEPHVQWLLKSAYNFQWALSYYNTICEISEYVFKNKHNTYNLQNELARHLYLFPDEDPCPPPCLFGTEFFLSTTEKSYRNHYKQIHARAGAYHKMITPWWIGFSRRLPVVRQAKGPVHHRNLEEDPFADLR